MNYTRRLVESQVLNKPTHIYACALIPNNRSEKLVECGVKRTCLQDELRIQTWTLVLGVLLVGQGLNLSFINTRICIRNQTRLTASAKETREHVKRVGMMLATFMGFQTFL